MKEPLFGSMKEYLTTNMYADYDSALYGLSGYQGGNTDINFVSPSSYYGDPTRIFDSSEGEELVGMSLYIVRMMFKRIYNHENMFKRAN